MESSCPEFAVVVGGGGFELAPGESLGVQVRYRPVALGDDSCSITLGATWCEGVTCTGRASTTWRVLADGSGNAPTVQAGIDSASNGDVVLVGPGRYYETINLRGKRIHLLGEQGRDVTILDGSRGDDSVVVCESGETNETVIEGFTITGGKGQVWAIDGRLGAGILCLDATPVIQSNTIANNHAVSEGNQSRGGGLFYGRGEGSPELSQPLVIWDNMVRDNSATTLGGGMELEGPCFVKGNQVIGNNAGKDGGAMFIFARPLSLTLNVIRSNSAGDHGGGNYLVNRGVRPAPPGEIEIAENLFVGNSALGADQGKDCSGGAIWVSGGAWIHHNTIVFNRAESRVSPGSGVSSVTVSNSIFTVGAGTGLYVSGTSMTMEDNTFTGDGDTGYR